VNRQVRPVEAHPRWRGSIILGFHEFGEAEIAKATGDRDLKVARALVIRRWLSRSGGDVGESILVSLDGQPVVLRQVKKCNRRTLPNLLIDYLIDLLNYVVWHPRISARSDGRRSSFPGAALGSLAAIRVVTIKLASRAVARTLAQAAVFNVSLCRAPSAVIAEL
jgi:hypothetical protein